VASLADRVIHLQDGRINRVETRVKAPQPEAREEIQS
jgi:hypothetical protein